MVVGESWFAASQKHVGLSWYGDVAMVARRDCLALGGLEEVVSLIGAGQGILTDEIVLIVVVVVLIVD